jgi:hypothetical protein
MNSNMITKTFGDGTETLQYQFQYSNKADKSALFSEEEYRKSFNYIFKYGAHAWSETQRCFMGCLNRDFAYVAAARVLCPEMADQFDRIECEVMLANRDVIMNKLEPNQNWDSVDKLMSQELVDAVIARCEDQELVKKFPELKDSIIDLANDLKEKMIEIRDSQSIDTIERDTR